MPAGLLPAAKQFLQVARFLARTGARRVAANPQFVKVRSAWIYVRQTPAFRNIVTAKTVLAKGFTKGIVRELAEEAPIVGPPLRWVEEKSDLHRTRALRRAWADSMDFRRGVGVIAGRVERNIRRFRAQTQVRGLVEI